MRYELIIEDGNANDYGEMFDSVGGPTHNVFAGQQDYVCNNVTVHVDEVRQKDGSTVGECFVGIDARELQNPESIILCLYKLVDVYSRIISSKIKTEPDNSKEEHNT